MKRALCPFCKLPRAMMSTIGCGEHGIPLVSCECLTRSSLWYPEPGSVRMRAIPMTENHDPGDEEQT